MNSTYKHRLITKKYLSIAKVKITKFKDKLTWAKMKEKQVIEVKNMAVIERVYHRLIGDKNM